MGRRVDSVGSGGGAFKRRRRRRGGGGGGGGVGGQGEGKRGLVRLDGLTGWPHGHGSATDARWATGACHAAAASAAAWEREKLPARRLALEEPGVVGGRWWTHGTDGSRAICHGLAFAMINPVLRQGVVCTRRAGKTRTGTLCRNGFNSRSCHKLGQIQSKGVRVSCNHV